MNPSHDPRSLTRRQALLGAGAAGLAGWTRPLLAAEAGDALRRKRLLQLTLYGGNDGLNTLVPLRDPLYRRLRPTLALPGERLLPLDSELGLNPHLTGLMKIFQAGEVAVVQDVGYPAPNLSHFESAAIWDSANPRLGTRASTGWWGETVMANRAAFDGAGFDAMAVTFEKSTAFADGTGVPVLQADQDVAAVLRGAQAQRAQLAPGAPEPARRLAAMINEGIDVRARFARRLKGVAPPDWKPYEEPFDVQARMTQWFFEHGIATPMVRLNQGEFDTHANLLSRHAKLMKTFDAGLATLRAQLQAVGLWNDTVVLVQSEFGRRVAENGYGGTDHGTAGPVFLIGGRVRGGVYGRRALLDDLDREGNLKHTTDFRSVYATLVSGLWGLPANPFAAGGFAALPIALA